MLFTGSLPVLLVLGVSILLQLGAAAVAVLNIHRTHVYLPWACIAVAIVLMGVRRITTFVHILAGWNDLPVQLNIVPELIALVISMLMLAGLLRLGPVFQLARRLAEEKDLLLHESLHSTKNNLQSLLSLFSVQESFLSGADERLIVADMERRVRVFVLLQEELFRSHAELGFREFMNRLVESISTSFEQPGRQVEVTTDLADIQVSDRELLYCGLVVNEALTNAFKHAVPVTPQPRIEVRSGTDRRGRYLSVRDNGPGMPAPAGSERRSSFGMTFLESLSGCNGWDLTIDGENGTTVIFRF
ncbi:MAG: sensor histidine kinase [Spirochaetaceae bacterium]